MIPDGGSRGYAFFSDENEDGKTIIKVNEHHFADAAALMRMLRFFGNLRDQYSALRMQFPAGFPFNWLLKEKQLPHRPVEHSKATFSSATRMQIRILDHFKFFDQLRLRDRRIWGRRSFAWRKARGTQADSSWKSTASSVEAVKTDATATFTCNDATWAAVVAAFDRASHAVRLGLADGNTGALDALACGPKPFCNESF